MSAPILANVPSADPLYRCVVDKTAEVTKYLIAYRSVTLIPLDFIDGAAPALDKPAGSAEIRISERSSVTHSVAIHAEDLYLHPGSKFNLPGVNLTITANRIIAMPAIASKNGAKYDEIHFDCSGKPPADMSIAKDGSPGSRNGRAEVVEETHTRVIHGEPMDFSSYHWETSNAAPGGPRPSGIKGNEGGPGGSVAISGKTVGHAGEKVRLVLNVRGSPGTPGQGGGRGGNAADVDLINWGDRDRSGGRPDINNLRARGGDGGNGGAGGKFGDNGFIRRNLLSDGIFTYDEDISEGVHAFSVPGGEGGDGGTGSNVLGGDVDGLGPRPNGSRGHNGLPEQVNRKSVLE